MTVFIILIHLCSSFPESYNKCKSVQAPLQEENQSPCFLDGKRNMLNHRVAASANKRLDIYLESADVYTNTQVYCFKCKQKPDCVSLTR